MTKTKEKKQPKVKYKEHSLLRHVRKEWKLYSFLVIPILYYVIFKYIPVIGNIIAFRRYRGGSNILGCLLYTSSAVINIHCNSHFFTSVCFCLLFILP